MLTYFQRNDLKPITKFQYEALYIRFACEASSHPIFSLYNTTTLEFSDRENVFDNSGLSGKIKSILEQEGFMEIPKPEPTKTLLVLAA